MHVSRPGEKPFLGDRFVSKAKRPFDERLVQPLNLPLGGEVGGAGIVIAANAEDGKIGGEAPAFDAGQYFGRQLLRAMQKVAEDQDSFGPGFLDEIADISQIAIEYRTRHRYPGRLEDFGFAPVRVCEYQRFLRVPVDRFAPVEGEAFISYFC